MALRISMAFLAFLGLVTAQSPPSGIRAKTEDGQQVLLMPNGKWMYVVQPRNLDANAATASGKTASRTLIKLPYGDGSFRFDPAKWSESSREGGRINYIHKSGKLYGAIISENFGGIPTSAMKDVALANARHVDPNVHMVKEEPRTVNGRELLYLEFDATQNGIQFRFSGYYHGGVQSDLQVITYTLRTEAANLTQETEEFLNGIEIREPSAPQDPSAPELSAPGVVSFGNFKLNYNRDKWTAKQNGEAGNWLLQDKSGSLYANFIAEDFQIPLDSLLQLALDNMSELDPLVRVIGEEDRVISGVTARVRRINAAPRGIPLTYLCYYYGGDSGAVQIVGWASRQAFDSRRAELEELMNGLIIEKPEQ